MDFNAIASQVVSSAVVGLITWGGGLLVQQVRTKNAAISPATPSVPAWVAHPPAPVAPGPAPLATQQPWPVRPPVHVGRVTMHAAALQFGANVIGLFVGLFTLGITGGRSDALAIFIAIQLVLGTIFLAAGFFVIALLVEHAVRWSHLTYVALGTAAMTLLVNGLFGAGPTSVGAFILGVIVALCQTFLAMGIGGGLAMLLSPRRVASGAPYPMPAAQPSQPYAWGLAPPYSHAPYPPYGPVNGPAYGPASPSVPFYQPGMPSAPLYRPGMPQYPPAPPSAQPSVPLYPQQPAAPASAPLSQPVYQPGAPQPGAPQQYAPPSGPPSFPVQHPYGPSQPLAGAPAAWGQWAPGAPPPDAASAEAQGAAIPSSLSGHSGQLPVYPPTGEQIPQSGGQQGIDHPHFQPW